MNLKMKQINYIILISVAAMAACANIDKNDRTKKKETMLDTTDTDSISLSTNYVNENSRVHADSVLASCGYDLFPNNATVDSLGEYSQIEYTEDHAYGISVSLWRIKSNVIGLFYYYDGNV